MPLSDFSTPPPSPGTPSSYAAYTPGTPQGNTPMGGGGMYPDSTASMVAQAALAAIPPGQSTAPGAAIGAATGQAAVQQQAGMDESAAAQAAEQASYDQTAQQTALSNAMDMYGPDLANAQNSQALNGAQMGIINAQFGASSQYLNGQAGLDRQSNGLQQQANQNNIGYNQGLLPLYQQIMGMNNQKVTNYQQQYNNLGQQSGNYDQMISNVRGMQGNLTPLLENQIAGFNTQAGAQRRAVNDASVAGGGWFAPERMLKQGDINSTLAQQTTNAQLNSSNQNYGYENQILGYGNNKLGISNDQLSNINAQLSTQQSNVNTQMDINRINNTLANLGINGQQLGLDKQSIDLKLNNALTQLGLQNSLDANKLYQMANSGNAQMIALFRQIVQQAQSSTGG